MDLSCESANVRAYIVGLGVPDKVSHFFRKLVRDFIGKTGNGDAKRGVYGYSEADDIGECGEERTSKVATWPMEPMVPILVCTERPKAPVAGLMPLCETAIEVGKRLMLDKSSRWLILPVNSNGWFENLRQKLSESGQKHETQTSVYEDTPALPLCLGLPLLCMDECGEKPFSSVSEINIDEIGGWKALMLICWEIEYLANRPWHHSVYWVSIWKRRLRRAAGAFNMGWDIA